MKDIPNYKITIDEEYKEGEEDLGWDVTAFTAKPAIQIKGMAFSATNKPMCFKDSVKMRIAAPAIIPAEIYRYDSETEEEYEVTFTAEEIEKIYKKKMKNFSNKNHFNTEHDANKVAPAYILEVWMVGKEPKKDRSYSEFGILTPTGSIFMVAQITDKEYYKELVDTGRTGFSIEGFFGMKLAMTTEEEKKEVKEKTYKIKVDLEKVDLEKVKIKHKNKMKKEKMSKCSRFSAKKKFAETAEIVEGDVTVVAEAIATGEEVVVIDENLEVVSDFTGELEVDGQVIEVVDGEIATVTPVAEASEETLSEDEDKKEEMSEETPEEVKAEETKEEEEEKLEDEVQGEYYTKAEIDAKIDEVMKLISDMNTEEVAIAPEGTQALSIEQRFAIANKYLQ